MTFYKLIICNLTRSQAEIINNGIKKLELENAYSEIEKQVIKI